MIISLIQALYDPRIIMPQGMAFFEKALEDIEYFEISPQIYWLLKQQGLLESTPSFFQERLREKYHDALYKNMFIRSQMKIILDKLEDAGIQTIPLKGTIFSERYFGDLGARGTSDIDLLVRPSELERAIQCVKSVGYTTEQERIPAHFHRSFSKEIPNSAIPMTIELHWNLLKENTSNLQIGEFWEWATPLDTYRYILELSDYHTFYMICLHGWRHNLGSLKYFLDIIQLINILREDLNYTLLMKEITAHRTRNRIVRTLAIVYAHFPGLADTRTLPSEWNVRLWWEYCALRDNKRSFKVYMNWIYYHIFDYDTVKHSLGAIFRFPYHIINKKILCKKKELKEMLDR